MSVEFEKVVLEKLKVLDELSIKVDQLSKDMRETKEIVSNHTTLINNLSEKVDQLEEKVDNNTTLINNLTKDVLDTQDIVKIQGQNLAKFEHECMLKLNALFDSFVANSESHAVFSKFIAQLNAESFDYRQRISKLEDYFRNSKILAAN